PSGHPWERGTAAVAEIWLLVLGHTDDSRNEVPPSDPRVARRTRCEDSRPAFFATRAGHMQGEVARLNMAALAHRGRSVGTQAHPLRTLAAAEAEHAFTEQIASGLTSRLAQTVGPRATRERFRLSGGDLPQLPCRRGDHARRPSQR